MPSQSFINILKFYIEFGNFNDDEKLFLGKKLKLVTNRRDNNRRRINDHIDPDSNIESPLLKMFF